MKGLLLTSLALVSLVGCATTEEPGSLSAQPEVVILGEEAIKDGYKFMTVRYVEEMHGDACEYHKAFERLFIVKDNREVCAGSKKAEKIQGKTIK